MVEASQTAIGQFLSFGLIGAEAPMRVASMLEAELLSWFRPSRTARANFNKALGVTLRCIVLNLVVALGTSRDPRIGYFGRRQWYADNRHWIGDQITQRSVEVCVSFLAEMGYVERIAGRSSSSPAFRESSSIRPLEKFKELLQESATTVHEIVRDPAYLPIRLKGPKAPNGRSNLLSLPDTDEVKAMASRVVEINRTLVRHWPDIELAANQVAEPGGLTEGKLALPDLTKRTVYRVFNNGTFEDGGRFYGGWWQSVPKVWRPYITINGKRTVEVDYSEMHPTIVHHWAGATIPENAYFIAGFDRDLVKRTFNALLNARGTSLSPMSGFDERATGVTWEEFLRIVGDHFKAVEQFFGTGVGLKLQRLDSDIAEAVMLEFAANGVPLLPIHDSFLCHHGYEQELRESMERHFETLVGAPIRLKRRTLTPEQRRSMGDSTENSISDLMASGHNFLEAMLSPDHIYRAYDDRLQTWFARKDEIVRTLLA